MTTTQGCIRCQCCGGCLTHDVCVCDDILPKVTVNRACSQAQNVGPVCNPFPHVCQPGKHAGEGR